MEKLEKKEISEKAASKALINSFITYGIIFGFIISLCLGFFRWSTQHIAATQSLKFIIASSILGGFILFFLFLFLVRVSSIDVFKKCKIDKSKIENVADKLTSFFIICAIISVMSCFVSVYAKHAIIDKDVDQITNENYHSFKNTNLEIADHFTEERVTAIYKDWDKYLIKLSISEASVILSLFYLTKYQKKMILKYNEQ